jgi:asparagine synthase (glutamine-hydrolysing)
MDEPLVEPAAIPTYLISVVARERVVVVLTGEGGDELFAGYPKYRRDPLARHYRRIPRFLRDGVLHRGLEAIPLPLRRLRVLERSLSLDDPSLRWPSWFAGFAGRERRWILHPDLFGGLADPAARGPVRRWTNGDSGRDDLTRMLYLDVKTWLADDLLMKKARVPFLDHRVVEFAFSLPSGWKLSDGQAKRILRESLGQRLPPEILRRRKAGFPLPLGRWFREDLAGTLRETLLSDRLARRRILEPAAVRRVVEDHLAGRRDHHREIWTLLGLELWYRTFLDPPSLPRQRPALSARRA